MDKQPLLPEEENTDGLPSWLPSWDRLYMIVLAELVFLILLFYLFSEHYA